MTIKRNDMEKSGIAIVVAGIALLAACSFGRRHTTIVENTNNHRIRIEYSGHVYFNKDETAIRSISRDGYLEYQNDDRKLNAKNDGHGGVSYELYEGYTKIDPNKDGKEFIAEAIKVIVQKTGHNLNMN
jgi:hypothetical protein